MPESKNLNSEIIHICTVSNDVYVVPTCVAIQSFIDKKKYGSYHIHILTFSLSEESEDKFMRFERDDVKICVSRVNKKDFLGDDCAALLKFIIPDVFLDIDKMLYLDSDLVVKMDLHELYYQNIEDYYAAVVMDGSCVYAPHSYVKIVKKYFDCGVMLLNLKKLRDEHVSEKLIETKKNPEDLSREIQNVFNRVFDGRVLFLPIRYNFTPVNMERFYSKWNIQQINEAYGTEYKNKKELFCDAVIMHYSSKEKPWKSLKGACASEWIASYLKAPIDHMLIRLEKRKEPVGISVIMPCYNSEKYLRQTLDSVLSQTFKEYEILCLDDGSTDNTLMILKDYERNHKCIRVFSNRNMRQGYERNVGICNAKGKYLYYMDSDDLLDSECFKIIYHCAEENQLDLLYFEGQSFYESSELEEKYPNYKEQYNRKNAFPRVYDGNELYVKFREIGGLIVSPCLQLARREYIVNNFLYFPEMPMLEDNIYTFRSMIRANRIKCLGDVLFFRRVRSDSTMLSTHSVEKIESTQIVIKELIKTLLEYDSKSPMYWAIQNHIRAFYNSMLKECVEINENSLKAFLENDRELGLLFYYMTDSEGRRRYIMKNLEKCQLQNQNMEKEIRQLKDQIKLLKQKSKQHC